MTRLRISIKKQNERINELSINNDYFTIVDPLYNSEHINIIVKNKRQEYSKVIVEHFYSIYYMRKLYEKDYSQIKRSVLFMIVTLTILNVILLTILIITFSYLKIKSLSLIPLFTLILMTIILSFLIINIMRLKVIEKVINNEYEIDRKYVFLSIYKLLKEETQDTPIFGLAEECTRLKHDCTA